ncbi:MAG: photosystem P840 reaction-center cytochrome c-551, partial [Rhizobacter sp.]|nr:photosystem P840 reaction-center cytochrome c-551 [Chlorobiales bacterium]
GEPPPGVAATAPTATAVADVSAYEPLFKKKCNACHTYKSVEGKVKNYVRQNRTEYLINWMQKMPNSGITKDDASKIIDYVKGTIKASS